MKLEEQVCSLELSKRLKELGVKQESLFWWVVDRYDGNTYVLDYIGSCGLCSSAFNGNYEGKEISAFTVAELLELLPYCVDGDNGSKAYLDVYKTISDYQVAYSELEVKCTLGPVNDKNLADCLAELLIKVKENENI